jgi:DNA polymerase-3 subunit beta
MVIARDALLGAARAVGEVIGGKSEIAVLNNLLVRAEGTTARLTGTNLDIQIEVAVECEPSTLAATVSASRLIAAVDTLRGGQIECAHDGAKLVISQNRATRTLPTVPVEEFPLLREDDFAATFEMDASALLRLLDAAHVAMLADDVARPYLAGVCLHPDGDHLVAAATDGKRLVRARGNLPAGAEAIPESTIVAARSVQLIRKCLREAEEGSAVLVQVNERKISVRVGKAQLLCKLIEGTYPDYTRVIPSANGILLKVHASEFERSILAAAALARVEEKGRTRAVIMKLGEESSEVTGVSPDGSVIEPLDGEFGPGSFEIGINSLHAAPLASVFGEAARLEIAFHEANRELPILITSPDRPEITAVMMPMRT